MVVALVTIFIVGYFFIAMEHPFKINKTASALARRTVLPTIYALCESSFLTSASSSLTDMSFVQ